MFEKCCDNCQIKEYEIIHNPKPISFSEEMDQIVKQLLWYVPNIDSYQSLKCSLIEDKVYDDFSFSLIMKLMGINEHIDVKWIEPKDEVSDEEWRFYENGLCSSCQKIIIARCKKLSKTNDLLRCVRNCIAHGQFSIVENYLIGFNTDHGHKKAIIKIKPQLLLNALKALTSPRAKEDLLAYAFGRIGYETVINPIFNSSTMYDLCIQKNGKIYLIEIKEFKGKPYIHPEGLEYLLAPTENEVDVERVLFIDTSRVTKEVRLLEKEIENFRIVDLAQVKLLLGDNPVDILQEM